MLKKGSLLTIVILIFCVGALLFAHNVLLAQKGPTKVTGEGKVEVGQKGYGVILKGYNAYEKVKVVRAIADIKKVEPKEALDMIDSLPYVVIQGATQEQAEDTAEKLKEEGCSVEVRYFN